MAVAKALAKAQALAQVTAPFLHVAHFHLSHFHLSHAAPETLESKLKL